MDASCTADIQTRERQWMQAWVDSDLATCVAILADDFLLTSARGTLMPRDARLPAQRRRQILNSSSDLPRASASAIQRGWRPRPVHVWPLSAGLR